MSTALEQSRAYWDAHARRDPLWAILSEPSRKNAGWDLEGFFQTGIAEIAALLYELDSRNLPYGRDTALDFGCGVGRLTQALAGHVDTVTGIDVSPQMIELARQFNQHGRRVSYVVNSAADLHVLGERRFDLIVTQVVLQHIEPALADRYVAEFFRVTRPGGLIVLQWPSHRRPDEDARPASPLVMPDAAYRMTIEIKSAPARLEPGATRSIDVEISNASAIDWSRDAFGTISAGNHWIDGSGRMIQRDDGRTALPSLAAGERCRLPLTITAPLGTGTYYCEIDLAHEGVLWFSDRGALATRFPVGVGEMSSSPGNVTAGGSTVASPLRPAARRTLPEGSLSADDPGEFPMHGRTQDEVARLVVGHGGRLLHVESDGSCGADWVSYRYYVRNGV